MTRGRQRLKASPLSPCSGPMLEGFGDFLRPPTRRTDVERSPVPRAADTSACCFPLADGACHDTQNSYTVTHQTAEASQVWGSNLLCFSAVKRVCKLNWTRVKNNHRPPCLALSPLYRNAADLSRGNAFSFFTVIKSSGSHGYWNTGSLLGLQLLSFPRGGYCRCETSAPFKLGARRALLL